MFGGEYRESVKKVSMTEKWLGKRVAKLSEKEQAMHKAWERHTIEFRRHQFKQGKIEMSERMLLDYEEYFTSD